MPDYYDQIDLCGQTVDVTNPLGARFNWCAWDENTLIVKHGSVVEWTGGGGCPRIVNEL